VDLIRHFQELKAMVHILCTQKFSIVYLLKTLLFRYGSNVNFLLSNLLELFLSRDPEIGFSHQTLLKYTVLWSHKSYLTCNVSKLLENKFLFTFTLYVTLYVWEQKINFALEVLLSANNLILLMRWISVRFLCCKSFDEIRK